MHLSTEISPVSEIQGATEDLYLHKLTVALDVLVSLELLYLQEVRYKGLLMNLHLVKSLYL